MGQVTVLWRVTASCIMFAYGIAGASAQDTSDPPAVRVVATRIVDAFVANERDCAYVDPLCLATSQDFVVLLATRWKRDSLGWYRDRIDCRRYDPSSGTLSPISTVVSARPGLRVVVGSPFYDAPKSQLVLHYLWQPRAHPQNDAFAFETPKWRERVGRELGCGLFVTRSIDCGSTWSKAVEVSDAFTNASTNRLLAPCGSMKGVSTKTHGVFLASKYRQVEGDCGSKVKIVIMKSTNGVSWKPLVRVPHDVTRVSLAADGNHLYVNCRSRNPDKADRRLQFLVDAVTGTISDTRYAYSGIEDGVHAGVASGMGGTTLLCGPRAKRRTVRREGLGVSVSLDRIQWRCTEVDDNAKVGFSDLAVAESGDVIALYETGTLHAPRIKMATFRLNR